MKCASAVLCRPNRVLFSVITCTSAFVIFAAAMLGKKVAVLDFVSPSPQGAVRLCHH